MGFFFFFKRDFAQAVNELMPESDSGKKGKNRKSAQESAMPENVETADQNENVTTDGSGIENNSTTDDLAAWRGYIQNDLSYCEKNKKEFHLPMQFQIIARVIPKENQSFQNDKDLKIHEFNHNGFSGNVYLWFDFKKYKDQLKDIINKQKETQLQNLTLEQTNDNNNNVFSFVLYLPFLALLLSTPQAMNVINESKTK